MSKRILIVDDEESITRYLYRTLRDKKFEIEIANSGPEGLKILENKPIDLIISDMRMPEMTGFELLSIVKQIYPNTIRIILSGDSDRDTIIKAIADGIARSYLTKPISNNELKIHIDRLFTTYDILHQNSLLQVIGYIDSMPVIPSMYDTLLSLIKQNKSMNVIAEFISNDPEYAAKILQIANSSLYGVKIGSVAQALVYLGLETVKQLILGTEIFRSFIKSNNNFNEMELLWDHSRMTNKLFHAIYRKIYNTAVPDEYSCCGLLHDAGILLMIRYFPEQYANILKMADSNNCSSEKAEQDILGVSHSSLGAYFLDWWNLPQSIVETCLYHHIPLHDAVQNKKICSILHISDFFSWKMLNKPHYSSLCEKTFGFIGTEQKIIEDTVVNSIKSETQK